MPINFRLLENPLNWIIVLIMAMIGGFLIETVQHAMTSLRTRTLDA